MDIAMDDIELASTERLSAKATSSRRTSETTYAYDAVSCDNDDAEFTRPLRPTYQEDEHARSWRSRARHFQERQSGWRMGVLTGLCLSIFVLCGNLLLLFVGLRYGGYREGIGVLAQGRSASIARINTAYHVFINMLSTLLLTASNYSMQVLCSPTRNDIDLAHSEGNYLSAGVLSPRNMRFIKGSRRLGWYVLMISSVTLHLFYNSAISGVTVGHEYNAHYLQKGIDPWPEDVQLANFTLDRFIGVYDTKYIADYGDVYIKYNAIALELIVNASTDSLSLENTLGTVPYNDLTLSWVPIAVDNLKSSAIPSLDLPRTVRVDLNKTLFPFALPTDDHGFLKSSHWTSWPSAGDRSTPAPPFHFTSIRATKLEDGSKVQIIMSYMIVVIISNVLKVLVMWLLWQDSSHEFLTTVGDVMQSFLQFPDRSTIGLCLMDKQSLIDTFQQENQRRTAKVTLEYSFVRDVQRPSRIRFFSDTIPDYSAKMKTLEPLSYGNQIPRSRAVSAGTRRWMKAFGIVLIAPALGGLVLIIITMPPESLAWGTASTYRLRIGTSAISTASVLLSTWLANAPQLALSALYIIVNTHLTRMCLAREWDHFGEGKRTLRVTRPMGEQRSTHFLQLPYRYAVPLTSVGGVLHWLLSQTIFLTRLEMRDGRGRLNPSRSYCTCGWSASSMFALLGLLATGLACVAYLSFRKVKTTLPAAVDCSLAISAACHPPPDDRDAYLGPVQWGVIESRFGGIKHCSMTSRSVSKPIVGEKYA